MLIAAVGLGATTAIFSVVDPILLRPLPFAAPREPAELHAIRPASAALGA